MGVPKRIALYGGTFDPVHVGHLAVARSLLDLFALDRVLFIPAHRAPHKQGRSTTAGLHRYAMLALATQGEGRFLVSTVELDAPERPYTVETLSRMREEFGSSARLFFVMGADSWSEITTWLDWERVLTLTDQIVMARPGYDLDAGHVTQDVRERIVDLRGQGAGAVASQVGNGGGPKIFVTDAVVMDVSATAVRNAVNRESDNDWRSLVPPPVADYIEKYGLYRDQA
ncbi:MAG TPA: nicotinate-nucleotide adenylyltransferase [Pyrinomonadaceae bacterium]|jgi:nicotinate-nucleotide adenylyltransferase